MTGSFSTYAVDEILRDGGSIHVRAIRPDDKSRLVEHFEGLSPQSVHLRFFGARRRLTEAELERFTELDFVRNAALVATLDESGVERIVGVGRYMSTAEHRAEVAFAVSDEHQGRGIGTILLEHLAPIARQNGISELEADVLGDNNRMLRVFGKSGYAVKRSLEAGVLHLSFPTAETEQLAEASLERDLSASAESVRHFLRPQAVAVAFSGGPPGAAGLALLGNLRQGLGVPLYVVHPDCATVDGVPAHSSLSAIGQPVDLVVIAAPMVDVVASVEDCARAGVRAVVVLADGFGETSEEGIRAEQELVRLVRRSGMRLLGPNSLGLINNDPESRMMATYAPSAPGPGKIGMLAQSGGLGMVLLDLASTRGIGLSSFVSVGNKADVSGNDLLAYWRDDPATAVVALYLESFGNPRRFARIAPLVARCKPIVAVKTGRSGAIQALGEGGPPPGERDVAVDALFQQAGVIRTDTINELFGVLLLLGLQPVPRGPRLGLVSNAPGPLALLTDACAACGLELAELEATTTQGLAKALPGARAHSNPVGLPPGATPDLYETAVALVGADCGVDTVVVLHVPAPLAPLEQDAAAIARGAAAVPEDKPVVVVFVSAQAAPAALHQGRRGRLPAFAFPEDAVRALAAVSRYGRWRRRPRGAAVELDRTAAAAVRAVVDRARGDGSAEVELGARDVATILRAADIAFAPSLLDRRDDGCGEPAHSGGDGIEAAIGVTTDALFGPLITCRLGGVLAEMLRDVAVRLTPLTDFDAADMVDSLRTCRLLSGDRGAGPGDRTALEAILLRVSALVEIVPELRGLELEPIRVLAPGHGAVVMAASMRV